LSSAAQTGTQANLEYQTARSAVETRTLAWQAQEQLWVDWMDSVDVALASGIAARIDAADRRLLSEATTLQLLARDLDRSRDDLTTKRRALQGALDREIIRLAAEQQRATGAERTRLGQMIDGFEAQAAELSVEERDADRELTFLYVRLGGPDPRGGVRGILSTIELVERRIADVDEKIAQYRDRIASLQRRLQRTRQTGDAASSLGRFGASDPVGASPTRESPSGQVATAALNPEDELQQLTAQMGLLEGLRRQLQAHVTGLRGLVPAGGGME
jgi:hypothetical protein